MTGKAPDATSIFHLTAPAADDAALKTLLGTATGNEFRVGPEHFLVSSAQVTDIVVGKDGAQWRVSSRGMQPTSGITSASPSIAPVALVTPYYPVVPKFHTVLIFHEDEIPVWKVSSHA